MMSRTRWPIVWAVVLTIGSMLLASTAAWAQGKGKGRSNKPAGWQRGEKKGWEGNLPPGIEKKGGWIPPGLSKKEQIEWKDGRPPGWSRGEKEGWKGAEMPPGWEKWNDKKKKAWQKELREAKEKLRRKAKKVKGFSKTDLDSALLSVEMAARKGVPIRHALNLVEKAIEKGIKGRGLETASRAMAYGVGKEIDFEQLSNFVHKKLNEGLRDEELAIEIYKEITRCHQERLKAKEAIQQEKRKKKGKKK